MLIFGRVSDKLISLPFCEYGGPLPLPARRSLGGGGKNGIDFAKFEEDALEEFGDNIKIKFHPQVCLGDENSEISTHWIENLKDASEQELLNSFRKTLRHSIRNAKQNNLEIKRCLNLKDLKQFYSLYVANLKRKKTVPYPFLVVKFLYDNPDAEILLALYENKIVGGSLFLRYDKFVHYFLSASNFKYRNLGANYLILWDKIRSLLGKDVIFDLGAAPRGSILETFKRGWGGKEYPILQIGIKRSPASAKASAGREESFLRSSKLIRNMWGLLPNFVIKKLSSKLIKYQL